jgi:hypothetical protein
VQINDRAEDKKEAKAKLKQAVEDRLNKMRAQVEFI